MCSPHGDSASPWPVVTGGRRLRPACRSCPPRPHTRRTPLTPPSAWRFAVYTVVLPSHAPHSACSLRQHRVPEKYLWHGIVTPPLPPGSVRRGSPPQERSPAGPALSSPSLFTRALASPISAHAGFQLSRSWCQSHPNSVSVVKWNKPNDYTFSFGIFRESKISKLLERAIFRYV